MSAKETTSTETTEQDQTETTEGKPSKKVSKKVSKKTDSTEPKNDDSSDKVLKAGKFIVCGHFHDGKEYKIGTVLEEVKQNWLDLGVVKKIVKQDKE